jgi:predicted nucleic acid-binding protein
MIVLDASVAAKWYINEEGSELAQEYLAESHHLIAPALIRMEVGAAIVRAFRENRISEAVARESCAAWEQVLHEEVVHLIPDDHLYAVAVETAIELRHAVQDCMYLSAAKSFDAPVLTADRTLFERGKDAVRIRMLGQDDVN